MTPDIAIIGGGLTGAVSALKAKEQGKEVLLVRMAWGATALGSGGFDVAGDILRIPGREWEDSLDIAKNIAEICRRTPQHPYSLVGEEIHPLIKNKGEWFFGLLREQGYEMKGSWEKNAVFPTALGTLRATAFSLGSLSNGNILEMKGARVLCLGISGLSDFNSGFLTRSLYEKLKGTPLEWKKAESGDLPLKGWIGSTKNPAGELSSQSAAMALDESDIFSSFVESVEKKTKGDGYSHILFPPVLGVSRWKENISALEKATGARCAEVFPLSPSIPGMRFQRVVDSLLGKTGINVIQGTVTGCTHNGRRVTGLRVIKQVTEEPLAAGSYILASGRFVGGGIKAYGRAFAEEIFGLSLISQETSMSTGVRVNPAMSPCDEAGGVLYGNLFCAGSVIGGYDPAHEMCGSGVALLTGVLAGENAVRNL